MRSLWRTTSPRIVADDHHAGEFERVRCDAVIVGAGLTGLTTAVLLARAGQSVTVLEARTAGAVTTGNTTGKLSLLQGDVLSSLREQAGDEVLQAYVEANREGQAWLIRELEARGETQQHRTAYTYATSDDQLEVLERELEASRFAFIAVEACIPTELPFETRGALKLEAQVQLHPMRVLALLAEELRERGGRLVEHCRVHDVETGEHGVRVVTELGTQAADLCVLATGTPILDRGLFFAKLKPCRSFVAAYRLNETSSMPQGMYLSLGEPTRSFRTAEDTQGEEVLVVGGETFRVEATGDTNDYVRELDSWSDRHFNVSKKVASWAAQDYRTHSRVPYSGELPRGGGKIFTATGYNKWGMSNAIAAALGLASEVLGGRTEWARTLNESGINLGTAVETLRESAAVSARLVAGWAGAELALVEKAVDLQEGQGTVVREGTQPVGICRVNGVTCRVSAVCTHLGGVLSWNSAERSWDCPLHGSRFSNDGTVLEGPAVNDLEQLSDEPKGR